MASRKIGRALSRREFGVLSAAALAAPLVGADPTKPAARSLRERRRRRPFRHVRRDQPSPVDGFLTKRVAFSPVHWFSVEAACTVNAVALEFERTEKSGRRSSALTAN